MVTKDALVQASLELLIQKQIKRYMETVDKHRAVSTSVGTRDPGRQVGAGFGRWSSNCGQQNEPYGNKHETL